MRQFFSSAKGNVDPRLLRKLKTAEPHRTFRKAHPLVIAMLRLTPDLEILCASWEAPSRDHARTEA
jgi:hypothetical protein